MSQMGTSAQPPTGNGLQQFIDFLNQRKKKIITDATPQQMMGTAPNASTFGGSSLMSPAMKSILGR